MKRNLFKVALCCATSLNCFALGAPAALAQSDPPTAPDAATATTTEVPATEDTAIVVTGTRLVSPNLVSANPVSVITGDQIFERGNLSVGDQLNDLPQLRSTFSQQNSNRFLGTSGLNLVDLRGLGTQRTLVLVNGRRHVGSDVLNYGVSVDVNTIPVDLIDRIDIVTGGASAVYGSDAIAGVVNFILKDDYEGIKLRAQNGISSRGDAGKQYVSLLAGQNFADGRGNIAVNAEFSHSSSFFATDRPTLRNNRTFIVTDTDPAGSTNGSDGTFDRTFYRDVHSATIGLGGLIAAFQDPTTAKCGKNVSAFTCTYLFQPDGILVPQTGSRIGIGPNGNFLGGNGTNSREGELLALAPDLKRYSANLLAHFEITPALVPFVEAKYVRTTVFGSQSGPFFSQGTTLGDPGGRERIRLDNPYLSSQARSVLTNEFLATTVNANTGANLTLAQLAAQQAAVTAGTFRFSLRRNWVDLGIRDEDIKRETYRIVGGLRGDFGNDWRYEISANYGEHKETNIIRGNVNVQRYLLAVDTTRDANGNIVCRSKLDPTNTISYLTGGSAADAAEDPAFADPRLAGDIAACVPLNPFGVGSVSQAARDYILVDSRATGKITQFDALAYIAGNTGGFFNLPGGPIDFSIGGEYRRETLAYDLDDLTQEGYAFYNAIPSIVAPSFKVKEAYGEINFPILKGVPFFEELSVRGNGRVADYKGAAGTVYAYGGEAVWKPIRDITLRGTYARAVRAPNLSELYQPIGQNFASNFNDPCSARNLATGSANRAANCTAAGAPAGYDFVYLQSLEFRSGGNPDLTEEKSDSYTAGVLLEPRFIPGLSISVDYYDIKISGVIAATGEAQDIANLCYDSATLNNPFCGLFERAGGTGGPNGEVPFQIIEGSLLQASANFAKQTARGLDTQINYVHKFDFGNVTLGAVWTHQFENSSFTDPTDPTFEDSVLDELGDPTDAVNANASVKLGKITFGYQLRWLGGMYLNTYEDYNSINGLPPQNADYAPIKKYPDVWYHDLRVAFDVTDNFNFYAGVDNVTDRLPPYGLTGVGGGSGIYDNYGRYIYAGIVAKY